MDNKLLTTSTEQNTHQDSVKTILPATHFVLQVLLAAYFFASILPAVHFVSQKNLGAFCMHPVV